MTNINPLLLTDFYKTIHHACYVPGMTKLVSYWTPRMTRKEGMNEVVMFGLQGFIKKYLMDYFNQNFFRVNKTVMLEDYRQFISNTMGEQYADTEHIEKLWDLGYLPIEIKAVKEGMLIPIKVPMIQITNTHPDFAWLVNYLETFISCHIWQPMTSATIAHYYRGIANEYFAKTCDDNLDPFKASCGDFSMRGMSSLESAESSGAGHLLSFANTATIPAIKYLEKYYRADTRKEIVGRGAPSTEHSVMCSYGKENEAECYRHLITEVYPNGNLSIVSDTYDYWNLITDTLANLKTEIMNRDGKIGIRGDSGDPVDIICGLQNTTTLLDSDNPAYKGTVELLWDIFGGTINSKGYKVLDPHVGAVYGDSITPERCREIYRRLEAKGFAACNVSLGIGSYTYQYNTRDTFGFALKATHCVVDGKERFIFKEPKTDTGNFKKSQKGMCVVYENEGEITYSDHLTIQEAENDKFNLLEPVFRDGKLLREQSLAEIRSILNK